MSSSEHIDTGAEPVRSYLLGTLEDRDAEWVEDRYFTDRSFFLLVRNIETSLIEDYLQGRLPASMKERFESRYLVVPDLRRRLDEVRLAQGPAIRRSAAIRLTAAAAIFLCVGGGALFWLQRSRVPAGSHVLSAAAQRLPIVAVLSLSPGVTKGAGASTAQLASVHAPGVVQLVLELPGARERVLCSASLSVASSSSGWEKLWSAPQPVWSTQREGAQRVVISVDSALLHPNDYQIEAFSADEHVHESYYFRVMAR